MSSEISALPDEYKKGAQIARGSFGSIHEGIRTRNDQDVILKKNRESFAHLENFSADEIADINKGKESKIKKEALVLAKLEHPHIVPVVDAYIDKNGDGVLVMKKVGESNLTEVMNQKIIPVSENIQIIDQIASAVDYANKNGVLHRDIKPGNILMEDGNAYLSDFGNSSAVQELTKDFAIGSPPYMSPEQTQNMDVPGDSEEYAVALLAYTLLTRQTVYNLTPIPEGSTSKQEEMSYKMHAIATREGLPEEAKAVLQEKHLEAAVPVFDKALSRKPEDRYKTATEFAHMLKASINTK